MKVYEVVEYNTSRFCAYHDVEVQRKPRGVITCPMGHKMHSDLNEALNIMKKATSKIVQNVKKPLSFIVGHNRIAPVKGCNASDLGGTPALQGGEEVRPLLGTTSLSISYDPAGTLAVVKAAVVLSI